MHHQLQCASGVVLAALLKPKDRVVERAFAHRDGDRALDVPREKPLPDQESGGKLPRFGELGGELQTTVLLQVGDGALGLVQDLHEKERGFFVLAGVIEALEHLLVGAPQIRVEVVDQEQPCASAFAGRERDVEGGSEGRRRERRR